MNRPWFRLTSGLCAFAVATAASASHAGEAPPLKCNEDAILVFDASGSMSGNEKLGIGSVVTRIDKVRAALARTLPTVTPFRRLGLMTYGPGPYNRCDNIVLKLRPTRDAGPLIMAEVNALVPAGRTPLTSAVAQAAEVLDYRNKPALVVLLTDGEETCGGDPCELGKNLKAVSENLVVHVIGYRMRDFSWTGGRGLMEVRCLAEKTGGQYFSTESTEDLVAALLKSLGCPEITERFPERKSKSAPVRHAAHTSRSSWVER